MTSWKVEKGRGETVKRLLVNPETVVTDVQRIAPRRYRDLPIWSQLQTCDFGDRDGSE